MTYPNLTNAANIDPEIFNKAKKEFDEAEVLSLRADITCTNRFENGPDLFGMFLILEDANGKKFKVSLLDNDIARLTENWTKGKAKSDFFLGKGAQV